MWGVKHATYDLLDSLLELFAELLLCPESSFYMHFMKNLLFHERLGLPQNRDDDFFRSPLFLFGL